MDNSEQTEKIIRYMDGELYGDELAAFELSIADNSAIKDELENLRLAKRAVQHYGLKQQVAQQHTQMMQELGKPVAKPGKAKTVPLVRYAMRMAAALLIFIAVAGTYEFITVSPASIAGNAGPYSISIARGGEQTPAIEKAYAEKNYHRVIAIFEAEKSPDLRGSFFAGQAFLEIGQPAKAILPFSAVVNSPSANPYKEDAEYYLGLSYLRNNNLAKAKVLLSKIHNDKDHLYHNKVSYFTLLKLNLLILKSGK